MAVSKKESMLVNEEELEDDSDMGDDVSESELEQESEEESEEEGDVRLAEPAQNATYNRDGLLEKLGDMSWPENAKWVDRLTLDIEQEQPVDVNDDLTRELAFYTQALNGTRMAFEKLQSMGLPFLRPEDYYAEMVKSDSHMEKVKSRLLVEKKNMEEADERRKAREAKKLSKEIQNQKLKERAKQKKESIESVKKWRKQRQQSGFAGGDKGSELDLAFEDGKPFEKSSNKRPGVAPGDRSGGKAKYAGKGKKPKKREIKDSKFGFGGRKGSRKQNVAETTNDLRGFNKEDGFSKNKKRKM
ncbi:probable rRNA-processing protein EBP2 homolog [Rosa rugosa]|uniref:probable rRNA-processing protein EBP2 homolog n=1 Tax=Rosa rugosa TaxID=74645 RepID=UPI002B400536|nr:probable rRNA-processing protein EBP2 homolog [Rosa rugosa]